MQTAFAISSVDKHAPIIIADRRIERNVWNARMIYLSSSVHVFETDILYRRAGARATPLNKRNVFEANGWSLVEILVVIASRVCCCCF